MVSITTQYLLCSPLLGRKCHFFYNKKKFLLEYLNIQSAAPQSMSVLFPYLKFHKCDCLDQPINWAMKRTLHNGCLSYLWIQRHWMKLQKNIRKKEATNHLNVPHKNDGLIHSNWLKKIKVILKTMMTHIKNASVTETH